MRRNLEPLRAAPGRSDRATLPSALHGLIERSQRGRVGHEDFLKSEGGLALSAGFKAVVSKLVEERGRKGVRGDSLGRFPTAQQFPVYVRHGGQINRAMCARRRFR